MKWLDSMAAADEGKSSRCVVIVGEMSLRSRQLSAWMRVKWVENQGRQVTEAGTVAVWVIDRASLNLAAKIPCRLCSLSRFVTVSGRDWTLLLFSRYACESQRLVDEKDQCG